jgi:hypothetical protein
MPQFTQVWDTLIDYRVLIITLHFRVKTNALLSCAVFICLILLCLKSPQLSCSINCVFT